MLCERYDTSRLVLKRSYHVARFAIFRLLMHGKDFLNLVLVYILSSTRGSKKPAYYCGVSTCITTFHYYVFQGIVQAIVVLQIVESPAQWCL